MFYTIEAKTSANPNHRITYPDAALAVGQQLVLQFGCPNGPSSRWRAVLCLLTLAINVLIWTPAAGANPNPPVSPDPSPVSLLQDMELDTLLLSGLRQQEAGQHAMAVQALRRAWQTSRVSHGLYHPAQIPLLEKMIESHTAMKNWQGVDDCYTYLELLYTRLYPADDVRLESGLRALSSWHVQAFTRNLDGKQRQHLRKARRLLQWRLKLAENTIAPDAPEFVSLRQSIQLSELHLYLLSERHQQRVQARQQAVRERLLATLD